MTLDGWVDIMSLAIDAHNLVFPAVIFVWLIFITHYVFWNMFCAILAFSMFHVNEDKQAELMD